MTSETDSVAKIVAEMADVLSKDCAEESDVDARQVENWYERLAALNPALRIIRRPLLVSGMLTEAGDILIDSESPPSEQNVTLWHELLHKAGMTDEAQVEAVAHKLAELVSPAQAQEARSDEWKKHCAVLAPYMRALQAAAKATPARKDHPLGETDKVLAAIDLVRAIEFLEAQAASPIPAATVQEARGFLGSDHDQIPPVTAPLDRYIERLLRECVPGGSICDPQDVADAIREWFEKEEGTP